ncbi:hypothetical protein SGPA1_50174 [Streptomyces misionensis JCM 4497]
MMGVPHPDAVAHHGERRGPPGEDHTPYRGGSRGRRAQPGDPGDRVRRAHQAAEERPVPGRVRRACREHAVRLGRHRTARPPADPAGRRDRPSPRRALRALPGRAPGRPRGQPEDPLERHRVLLPLVGRVRVPHRQPDRGRRPGPGAQGRGPRGHDLPAAALQPRERRVLARRPGRTVGRPPPLPGRVGGAVRHPRRRCARAGRHAARGHRPGARRARPRRRHRGGADRQGHRRARRGTARLPLRDAAGQGRVRDRRAAEGRGLHGARLRGRGEGPRQGRGHQRALHRGHLLPARPRRGQRRRLRLHLRRRPARLHPALGPQRRPRPLRRPAAARRRRGDAHPLHRRRHAHPARQRHVQRAPEEDLRRRVRGPGGRHRGGAAGRQVPRLPRRRAAGAGREAGRVGPGRGPGRARAGAGPAAPLDPARHRAHARHGRPRLRRRADRDVRGRRAGAGHGAHRRAGPVLPGRRPHRAGGVPGHRRPDRGRHPGDGDRQPEPFGRSAAALRRGRGVDGRPEGLIRSGRRPGTGRVPGRFAFAPRTRDPCRAGSAGRAGSRATGR